MPDLHQEQANANRLKMLTVPVPSPQVNGHCGQTYHSVPPPHLGSRRCASSFLHLDAGATAARQAPHRAGTRTAGGRPEGGRTSRDLGTAPSAGHEWRAQEQKAPAGGAASGSAQAVIDPDTWHGLRRLPPWPDPSRPHLALCSGWLPAPLTYALGHGGGLLAAQGAAISGWVGAES